MEVVQNLIKQLREILSKLSVAQQVLFGLAGASILIAGIAVALLGGRTDWRLLYGRLDAAEVGRIVSVLESQKIPHRIVSGGNAIQVSAEQVHSVRAQLAAKGMPKAMAASKDAMKTKTVIWRPLACGVWRLLQSR